MNTILVSYDLQAPGKDYSRLWEHLKSYSQWAKPLESVWLIKTAYTAEQIRDTVTNYVDWNDKVFVVDVTSKEAAWTTTIPTEVSNWIKANL